MFKLIGVIVGFFLFEGFFWTLFGMTLGLFIGSIIDRIRAFGRGALNPLKNAVRQAVFLETMFTLMGKLAKADGRISQQEIDHVEAFMHKLNMQPHHRQQAITWFKKGADPSCDLAAVCKRFNSICGHTKDLSRMLLIALIVMAHADSEVHDAEEQLLADIARALKYNDHEYRLLVDMVKNQGHFANSAANKAQALEDAYKALGVTAEQSDAEIKRAYRKLMSQYHPDKLMGQGMPEDMIKMATEQAKEIQLAYDLIEQHRKAQA